MLWRILQIRNNGKSGTYNNIMTGFESTFKDVINYWGECNANKAWNEIKQVMQWVNNDYDKVDSKHVKLYLWTHEDGTQPLLRGDVESYDERAYIAVQKTGEIDNANVNNAEFGIYSKKACDDDSLICKISTNKDGYAVTNSTKAKKLKAGTTYHIKETKAPAGSKINNKVYSVKTVEGNNSKKKAVKIDIVDEQQKVKISVTKVDKDDNSKKLSGATFRIYQWNATSKTYETYKDYTTGANGKLTTDWLYYTKTNTGKFRIEEISAPTNYKKATFKRDIQIGDDNTDKTLEYTVENEKYPGWIEIHKAAFLDNKDVSDKVNLTATFSIYSDAACTKNVGSITTNSSGFGKSGDLKEGTYYVKETKWTGRLKPSFKEAQEVRVNSNATTNIYGKPGELAGQTPDSIGIKLIKADEENRLLAIEGAVFEIREWNGSGWTLKYTEKTNKAGVIEIPVEDNKLYYTEKNQGKFMITEVSAPSGYEKDDSPKYITINDSNAGTTIDLGVITNKPKGGSLEIKKVITDINGEKITGFPMDDDFLQITYALFTDEELKHKHKDSIKLDKNGYARIDDIPAGIYYLTETTYNKNVFATSNEASKKYIEITIKRNNTTYIDGEKGYSEDGIQWFDCWNNISTLNQSVFYNVNNLPDFSISNKLLLNNPFNTYKVSESFGISEYQVVKDTDTENKKTIKDVKDNWKDLSDEELDEIIGNTDDKALSEFITDLSDKNLKIILSKETKLTKPYITYKSVGNNGELEKSSEEIYWKYLVNLSREPETISTLNRKSGYFNIVITGDGKTTNVKIGVSASGTDTDDEPVTITYSVSGTNNHGFVLRSASKPTELAYGGNYNRMFCNFSYTKPAHYVSSGDYSGSHLDYYTSWHGNTVNAMNNRGHNTVNVTEYLTAGLHVVNAGLLDRGGKTYHATMAVNLSKQYGGVRVNPNGGTWVYNSNRWTTDTGAYWGYLCGSVMSIPNPVRTGYTFKGWTVSNGANAHGSLSGNIYGSTITSDNSILSCGGNATSTAQATTNGYYTTLTANWQVNSYNVTCIDVVGTNQYGKELARNSYKANYGTTTSGATMGSDSGLGAYHKGYYYTGSSYATVTENGATVYRFFSKSPAEVQAPNVLKNVLKTVELDIIKTDSENEAKTLDATFNVLEWSKKLNTYVPYLTGIKAQQRVILRLTFDNLGKYKVVETDVQSDYSMSGATAEVSIYDKNAFEIPFYENVLGVDDDKGVFVNGRGYNTGDIVRDTIDKDNSIYYKCLIANVGKNVTDTTYWQKIELGNYVRYTDLVNGAGKWDEDYKVRTVMAVRLVNVPKTSGYTDLSINKENASGNVLTGAEFAAYYADDNSLCEKFLLNDKNPQYKTEYIDISDTQTHSTYNEQTKIRTLNLVIKEEVAPVGYKKAKDIKVVIKSKLNIDTNKWEAVSKVATFEDGTTVDITSGIALTVVDEEIKLNIALTKKATKGNLPVNTLEGAVYGIYDNAECTSLVSNVVIDNKGKSYVSGLTLKDYWIKEITAPTSGLYKLSDEVKHIKISDVYDNTKDVSEVNASVTVTDELILGEVLINKSGYTDMTFTKSNALKNAGFILYEMPSIPEEKNEDEYIQSYDFSNAKAVKTEVKTDINGIARFNDLPMGDYVIVETTVPDGFVKTENRIVHLTKEYAGNNDDTAYKVSLYNRPYNAQVKIRKVSSLNDKPLENAVFKIFDVAANGYIAEKVFEADENGNEIEKLETKLYTTDEDGFVTTESLKAGTYRIEEVLAPDGYIKNTGYTEVIIKDGNEAGADKNGYPYFEVTVKNTPTDTYFKKVDITTKEEITGGHYTVSDAFGNVVDEWDGTGEAHHIYGLAFNEEYTFTEEIAPDGYVVAESITFNINDDGTPTEIIMEDDYNKLEISKQDITTGDELPNAHLQILNEQGKVVYEWISTTKPHRIDRIPAGTYVLKETKAPDGYIISEEIEFVVGESAEVQKVVMYDDYTKTAFIKLAEDTQDYLEGCVLQVIDENGKVVDEWTTTKETHYTYRLSKGDTYTLHEVSAPDEYELAKDIKFVAGEKYVSEDDKALIGGDITDKDGVGIDDDSEIFDEKDEKVPVEDLTGGGNGDDEDITYADSDLMDIEDESDDNTYLPSEVVTITMTDSPLSIYPEKVDENGNPIYGAKLQILDEDNNVVYEWETDVMQTPGFKVKPGIYTLHEVKAPSGYLKFKDTKVTVTDKDVSIKLVDYTMGATITKVDENGNLIEGALLQVLDKDNTIVNEWTSTKNAHVITTLNDGETYTLHEVSSPSGYTLASDVTFTMDKANVKVEMVNKKTDLTIKKVNPFGIGINGAKLQILGMSQAVVKEFISESDGVNIKGLPKGDYILREVSAPDGYVKSPDVTFTIGDESLTVKMVDEFKSIKLPLTGGTPLNLLIIAMPLILLGTVIFLVSNKKKCKAIK